MVGNYIIWYSKAENDVFPDKFDDFLVGDLGKRRGLYLFRIIINCHHCILDLAAGLWKRADQANAPFSKGPRT